MKVLGSLTSHSRLSPSYYHSFGVTENYIVFLEQPFKLDILKMSTAYIRGVNWASCLSFHKEDQVRPGQDPQPHCASQAHNIRTAKVGVSREAD